VAKLFYRPFGLVLGILAGTIAGLAFKQTWKAFAHENETPKPRESDYGWRQILLAAALQGAIVGLVKAAVDRSGARAFEQVTGTWPGD
jgi:uncharacterized membrane protein YraQ (UPF0718 family)